MAEPEIVTKAVEVAEADLPNIEYSCPDGVTMSESDFQARSLICARHFLGTHFRQRRDVYVNGNILMYYELGKCP